MTRYAAEEGQWDYVILWSDEDDMTARGRALLADGWEWIGPPLGAWHVQWEDRRLRWWAEYRRPRPAGGAE